MPPSNPALSFVAIVALVATLAVPSAGCDGEPTPHLQSYDATIDDGAPEADTTAPDAGAPTPDASPPDAPAPSPDASVPDGAPPPPPPPCGQGPKPTKADTVWPTPTKTSLCQGFGNKISYQTCGFHTGVDVCTSAGSPILSMAAGKVIHVGPMWYDAPGKGRGPYAVIVEHSPGFYSTYGHNEKALVEEGDCVAAGDQIATIGSLGYSSGPHLHMEVLDNTTFTGDWAKPFANACEAYVDPMDYISP